MVDLEVCVGVSIFGVFCEIENEKAEKEGEKGNYS